jgi:hypothetical protein
MHITQLLNMETVVLLHLKYFYQDQCIKSLQKLYGEKRMHKNYKGECICKEMQMYMERS